MIVCKITLSANHDENCHKIYGKIMDLGDFVLSSENSGQNLVLYFASVEENVDEDYLRKMLRKTKQDFMIHTYHYGDTLETDNYVNQWVLSNLDKQLQIEIENKQQPVLQQIDRRLDLINRLADEMQAAYDKMQQEQQEKAEVENKEKIEK